MNITFLGTASAQPSSTRNHSSLALRLNSDVWLFDCGEATQHQLQKSDVRMGRIRKIFITHTHGDHIFGLMPLLSILSNGAGGIADGEDPRNNIDMTQPPLEIYGPLGTRAYIRSGVAYTQTLFAKPYVVHELRFSSDPQSGDYTDLKLNAAELSSGRNIPQVDGIWPDIFKDDVVSVSAGPILHSAPCVGYVVTEAPVPVLRQLQRGESVELSDGTVLQGPARRPGRKVVILGDTYDPSPIASMAADADILIHEATNAHLPGIDVNTKETDTFETVEARTKSRGHSTPQMAGAFAKRVGARKLILNHFSARYAGNDDVNEETKKIMTAIGDLATSEYGNAVICARDFMSIDVSPRRE